MKSLINSLKKEPKLLKWFPTSPRPQWRPQPWPQTPPAGRRQSGQRMPSSPCELFCGLASRWQVTSCPCPYQALATPIPSPYLVLRCCVSMETPLCLLPGLPLVRTNLSHLLSGGGTASLQPEAPHLAQPIHLSCPQAPPVHVSSQEEQTAEPSLRQGSLLGTVS